MGDHFRKREKPLILPLSLLAPSCCAVRTRKPHAQDDSLTRYTARLGCRLRCIGRSHLLCMSALICRGYTHAGPNNTTEYPACEHDPRPTLSARGMRVPQYIPLTLLLLLLFADVNSLDHKTRISDAGLAETRTDEGTPTITPCVIPGLTDPPCDFIAKHRECTNVSQVVRRNGSNTGNRLQGQMERSHCQNRRTSRDRSNVEKLYYLAAEHLDFLHLPEAAQQRHQVRLLFTREKHVWKGEH